jgi:capsular polysaccharide transport system permease protein
MELALTEKKMISFLKKFNSLMLVTLVFPTVLAALYFGVFASDIYISESRFVVRSPDKPSGSGLGVLLKSAGFSNAGDEIYAAQDYVKSRDALKALNDKNYVGNAYGGQGISIFDRFNPLGWDNSFEELYKYYQSKVTIQHETVSSTTTMTVRAYSPQVAHKINLLLLEQAEALVNRLNERGRKDLIEYALREVDEAKAASRSAGSALANYRNREGVVDPEKQATVQLQMISKLQDELIATQTQLLQLRTFTPQNPQIPVLRIRVKGLQKEIDKQLGRVAGDRKSLAATAEQYQRLQLEAQFADRQLAAAMTSLQDAKNEARRKQAYVERIVAPNIPDKALEPRRLRGVLATFMLGLIAWGVMTMLLAGVREHKD